MRLLPALMQGQLLLFTPFIWSQGCQGHTRSRTQSWESLRVHRPSASPVPLSPHLPGRPRMVKYGRHSVNPELCCTQLLQSPSYWNTEVTGLSYRSWVLHISIPVAAMQPARPRRDKRSPTTWHVVVAMALAAGPRSPGASLHPPAGKVCGLAGRREVS